MSADDLVGLLRHAAVTWPDKTAWVFDATDDRLTFADLDRIARTRSPTR